MELLVALVLWIVVGLIGYAIRPQWGFLLGFVFGPIGWLLAAVLRIGDTSKARKKNLLRAGRTHVQVVQMAARSPRRYIPPPPGRNSKLKIARDGVELGEWSEQDVAGFLQTGELQGSDYYFDHQTGQWLELLAHPGLN
ncbi:MAG: hypothetical protein JWM59_1289 [Verrucomicrobiales bacterium]|nr:hypothetical protein [Verrucomicrobiales bacterium]